LGSPAGIHVLPLLKRIQVDGFDQLLTLPLQLSKQLNFRLF
jgi:hypothetical protein